MAVRFGRGAVHIKGYIFFFSCLLAFFEPYLHPYNKKGNGLRISLLYHSLALYLHV